MPRPSPRAAPTRDSHNVHPVPGAHRARGVPGSPPGHAIPRSPDADDGGLGDRPGELYDEGRSWASYEAEEEGASRFAVPYEDGGVLAVPYDDGGGFAVPYDDSGGSSVPYEDGSGVGARLAVPYDDGRLAVAYEEDNGIGVPAPLGLMRPGPPRTWRDRLDDALAAAPAPGRVLAGAVAAAVLGVVGWRMLAPPPPPPEMELPFAEPAAAPATGEGQATPGPDGSGSEATPGAAGPDGEATDGAAGPGGEVTGEVVVHVAGAVATPGVRRLPAGARVIDGVDAAGGALPDADLARVNLAAPLVDGQQVYVPRRGEVPPVPLPGTGAAGGAGDDPGATGAGPVDVNRATADQLDELPGIGPATAEAIIAHREEHGPFASVDDLLDVRGIGEAKLEQLRELVTV